MIRHLSTKSSCFSSWDLMMDLENSVIGLIRKARTAHLSHPQAKWFGLLRRPFWPRISRKNFKKLRHRMVANLQKRQFPKEFTGYPENILSYPIVLSLLEEHQQASSRQKFKISTLQDLLNSKIRYLSQSHQESNLQSKIYCFQTGKAFPLVFGPTPTAPSARMGFDLF